MDLRDLVPINEYRDMVEQGFITVRKHPDYDLFISNYSPEAQFSSRWNRSTMQSRGLITDARDQVIARPWAKFFNLGERDVICGFDDPVEVMDKLDGSLGILYQTPRGSFEVATRGSFASDQAIHATALWRNKYDAFYRDEIAETGYTFLFEIIYKENQIVLNYGDMDDLVLLGAVHIENGYYLGPIGAQAVLDWWGPVAEVLPHKTISEALHDTARDNAEGFVVRYHNSLVKIKQPDYLDKHRLRFELTPKRIWEHAAAGTDMIEMVKGLPDEFQDEILETWMGFTKQAAAIIKGIETVYSELQERNDLNNRADWARAVKDYSYKGAIFAILDDKDYMPIVWKAIKPVREDASHTSNNDT